MNACLDELQNLECIAYLDNILIYGRSFEEQLENLEAVIKFLKERG